MSYVIVRSYDNYIDANIVLGHLASEGIQAFLIDEYTNTILGPILASANRGIRLTVRKEDEFRAKELLEQFDREKGSLDLS